MTGKVALQDTKTEDSDGILPLPEVTWLTLLDRQERQETERALMIIWTDPLLQVLLQTITVVILSGTKYLVKPGGHGWVRTSDPPLVRRVLFH